MHPSRGDIDISLKTVFEVFDFFVKDVFNDNNTFGLESSTFLDFTDTDPFSEGDL